MFLTLSSSSFGPLEGPFLSAFWLVPELPWAATGFIALDRTLLQVAYVVMQEHAEGAEEVNNKVSNKTFTANKL